MDKNKRLTPICIVYVDGERLGPAWEGRFRSIRVVDRLSGISGCAIVFSGDNSGKMDTEIFSVGSTISVYMGYKDDMRETFNGEVATFASTLPEAGGSSKLVVTAASYLGQLDRNEQSRVFENLSPSRIIQKILSEYGLQADCESFGPVKERLKEEGMSDWKFI
ncbi:MAG: phage late control D family protein, partial [Treponema sp.]|nr:phage late control D family protein [Treponema sp.]